MLTARSLGVTHPVLPCGAKVLVRYGGDTVLTEVIDNELVSTGRQFELTPALAQPRRARRHAAGRVAVRDPAVTVDRATSTTASCSTLRVAPGSQREPTITRRELGSGRRRCRRSGRAPTWRSGFAFPARGHAERRALATDERRIVGLDHVQVAAPSGCEDGGPALLRRPARARGAGEAAAARGARRRLVPRRRAGAPRRRRRPTSRRPKAHPALRVGSAEELERLAARLDGGRPRRGLGRSGGDPRARAGSTSTTRGATGSSSRRTPDGHAACVACRRGDTGAGVSHEVGTKSAQTRTGSADSVTSGTRECPWGHVGVSPAAAARCRAHRRAPDGPRPGPEGRALAWTDARRADRRLRARRRVRARAARRRRRADRRGGRARDGAPPRRADPARGGRRTGRDARRGRGRERDRPGARRGARRRAASPSR